VVDLLPAADWTVQPSCIRTAKAVAAMHVQQQLQELPVPQCGLQPIAATVTSSDFVNQLVGTRGTMH
jgi:hypothetical protein